MISQDLLADPRNFVRVRIQENGVRLVLSMRRTLEWLQADCGRPVWENAIVPAIIKAHTAIASLS